MECGICGKELDDAFCSDCYAEVNGAVADLQSLGHNIDWGARQGKSDVVFLNEIKESAEKVLEEVRLVHEKRLKREKEA